MTRTCPAVIAVDQGGIHDPDPMPFSFPWTDATGAALELGVWHEEVFVRSAYPVQVEGAEPVREFLGITGPA